MKVHLEISAEKLMTLPNSTIRSPQQLIEFLGKLLEAGHLIWPDELKDWYITEFKEEDMTGLPCPKCSLYQCKCDEKKVVDIDFLKQVTTEKHKIDLTKRKHDTPTHLCPYCQHPWAVCICKTGQG